tara:strand:- start:848 stop:1096 length:249 start_codon:yes stop_codon:yes gene_type:complete
VKKYGETESDIWAKDSLKCREIVSEIMNFGVSQTQILQVINLLAMELEDRNQMLAFRNIYRSIQEEKPLEGKTSTSKIILDS